MIKHCIVTLVTFLMVSSAFSQEKTLPVYKQFPQVPPFDIVLVPDSTRFKKADLKKKKPVIVVVFSPDCDHCKHATKDLLAQTKLLKEVQVVMASNLPFNYIKQFHKDFDIAIYPGIKMGWDDKYFLSTYYEVRSYPAVFVYDKKGQLVQEFAGSVSFEKIAAAL